MDRQKDKNKQTYRCTNVYKWIFTLGLTGVPGSPPVLVYAAGAAGLPQNETTLATLLKTQALRFIFGNPYQITDIFWKEKYFQTRKLHFK